MVMKVKQNMPNVLKRSNGTFIKSLTHKTQEENTMKKSITTLVSVCLTFVMAISLTACGGNIVSQEEPKASLSSTYNANYISEETEEKTTLTTEAEAQVSTSEQAITSAFNINNAELIVTSDVEHTIATLKAEYNALVMDIDTYEKYLENADRIEAFYNDLTEANHQLSIRMRNYSAEWAEAIMLSDKGNDDKYDDFDDIYDTVYDDTGDEIYDEIYDGILDDMYDQFYDGILDDAYKSAEYDEWSDARSDEYDWWSDSRSDVYDDWSDSRSDIYDFWSDMRGELWDDDVDKATEKLNDFKDDVEKLTKS